MFTGSYHSSDAIFLLKPIQMQEISIEEKERLIQSGKFHYSQILSKESIPDEDWHRDFFDSIERNGTRMVGELLLLCCKIIDAKPEGPLALVSLARAGTPMGALLHRCLERLFHREVFHYSISIIRDRGVDENALLYILSRHKSEDLFFIDGWGAKGSIANELHRDIADFNRNNQTNISDKLYVLSDLCGKTDCSVSSDDYLIPGAMMNSTISGLISRTILNEQCCGPNDFHGCVFFSQFVPHDLSNWFLDEMYSKAELLYQNGFLKEATQLNPLSKSLEQTQAPILVLKDDNMLLEQGNTTLMSNGLIYTERETFLNSILQEYKVTNMNEIKPGICESTRAMLRRNWHLLLVKNRNNPDLNHLIRLAEAKKVSVIEYPTMPFWAVSVAKREG